MGFSKNNKWNIYLWNIEFMEERKGWQELNYTDFISLRLILFCEKLGNLSNILHRHIGKGLDLGE